jgi:hypothetical protein
MNFKPILFKTIKNKVLKVIFYLILAFFVLVLILIASLFWMYDPFNFRAPKDQKLISIFHAHHEAFEKIQQMAIEDSRHGLYFDGDIKEAKLEGAKIDETRLQEYKNLLSEIRPGLDWGIDGRNEVVRFLFAGGGGTISSDWVKGIEYVPNSFEINGVTYRQGWEGVVLTNLDNARTLPANIYLRPIESNWFLFYQRDE